MQIIITGCTDCPFCYEHDMGVGYGCRIDKSKLTIRQSKHFQPKTPAWCPVKKEPVTVRTEP